MSSGKSMLVFGSVLGSGPVSSVVVFAVAFRGKTQIWLGDLRVVWLFLFFCCRVLSGFAQ